MASATSTPESPARSVSATALRDSWRRLLPLLGLVAMCLFFGSQSPQFWTLENWFNLARQQSVIMLIAFGATLVIIAGQIDLSVGSVAAFCGIVTALALNSGRFDALGPAAALPVAIVLSVACGVAWSALNAWLVGWGRLPAFVATLGTAGIARGLGYMLCGGTTVDVKADIGAIAGANPFGLPLPFWIIVLCAALSSFVLKKSLFGRRIYAVGGNAQAARYAGIQPRLVLLGAYAASGALVGIAAMIEVARNSNSAQPNTGDTFPLDAIAAVVIGGGSLLGGVGSIAGTIIGALIIAVLRNGLTLLGRDPFEQMVLIGVLIVASVAFDQWRQKK